MNFIEAVKKSKYVRRPIAKHLGSHGDGWIDARFVFDNDRSRSVAVDLVINNKESFLSWDDLMADDWEAKPEPCKHRIIDIIYMNSELLNVSGRCIACGNKLIAKWEELK